VNNVVKNAHRFQVEKPEGKVSLRRRKCRTKDEIGCVDTE